ncbi:hypothetical protein CCAX7_54720 [Capsulimonas corticalis]|uniref:Uncharacterized protein n=1 Tax=Capsulimonas corticalis TaxID=2219043 RepID=A0A402D5T8_9BACT|nr:phage portal protein [Capsulimonas corticalis]BDI33421.1 hypothetical protein CCAX7_54720 [Capsulimonas corticalis]
MAVFKAGKLNTGKLPGLRQQIRRGLNAVLSIKDGGVTAEGDAGWSVLSGRNHQYYRGSVRNWQNEAGPLWENPAISIGIQYIFNKVAEPRLQVVSDPDGTPTPIPGHALIQLLRRPNGEYSWRAMLQACAASYKLDGNAYIVKVRGSGGYGSVQQLWYIAHWQMEPLAPLGNGPTEFYKRTLPNGKTEVYARANVIHFKNGLDLENNRKGYAPFRAEFREVVSDNEIATFTASILKNLGVAIMISPVGDDAEMDTDTVDELKDKVRVGISADNRGGLVMPSIPVRADRIGSTPQEMALDTIGDRPESRIFATLGIEPMAVGLPSGNTKYANKKEAREASYENGIIPMLSVFGETLTDELLPDFHAGQKSAPDEVVAFNYDKVRDLQPDLDAKHKRFWGDFKNGIGKLSEARAGLGYEKDEQIDGYYFELMPAKTATPDGSQGVSDDPDAADK